MDSLKKGLITVSVIAGLLAIALSFILGRGIDREEIHRAQLEMQQLRASRDSIETLVAIKDSMQNVLSARVEDLTSQTDRLRREVEILEEERAENQLTVRNIRKKEDLQNRLAETFPEMAESDWGVTEVYNEEFDVGVEYLLVPLWFSETFIIDHQNSESYKQQVDRFSEIDSLHQQVSVLKDSLFTLEREKTEAYQRGYQEAFAKYEDINAKYIDLLEQPPSIDLGVPKWTVIGASIGAGVLAGSQLK
jgi:TolA-binding protein